MPSQKVFFEDRLEAGRKLARQLVSYRGPDTIVLALPRGGVPVASEIAKLIRTPLDTVVSRKIGAPGNQEFAVGAIAPGDILLVDRTVTDDAVLSERLIEAVLEKEKREMERRIALYRSGSFGGGRNFRNVILVDDGIATGHTMIAAIESVKILQKPEKIIVAVPVGEAMAIEKIRPLVDEVVCHYIPEYLIAVGLWYQNFEQISDEEVVSYLEHTNVYSQSS